MKAYSISREALETIGEGTYWVGGEQETLQQYDPLTDGVYKGAHLRIALVKSSETQLSGIPVGIGTMVRTDGKIILEAWVRADQVTVLEPPKFNQAAKFVCDACSKDLGAEVTSPKPSCPRCTGFCRVVTIEESGQVIELDKMAAAAIGRDMSVENKMRMRFIRARG